MRERVLTNLFSGLILSILILGINLQKANSDRASKRFSYLIYSALAYQVFITCSEIFEGRPAYSTACFIANLLAFVVIDVILICFGRYLSTFLEGMQGSRTKSIKLAIVVCCLRILTTLALSFSGHLFSIVDGCYVEEDLAFIPYVTSAIVMIILLITLSQNREFFTKRERVVMCIYLLQPLPPIVLEMYTGLYSLTGIALTLSILLVYVLIQATALERGKLRESVLEEISSTDLLTGLNNRRAYYSCLAQLEPQQNVGIVFCDLNQLKRTNDELGHSAGDELIRRFAALLGKSFRSSDIYRISGDEFVVILPDINELLFLQRVNSFRDVIRQNSYIAAVGLAFGLGSQVEQLIADAEELMYEDKRVTNHGTVIPDGRKVIPPSV